MDLTILTTSYFKGNEKTGSCRFSESYDAIYVYLSGHATIRFNKQTYELGQGDVLIIPAQTTRYECSDPADPAELLSFRLNWSDRPKPLPLVLKDTDGRLRQLAQWLYGTWGKYSEYMDDIRRGLLGGIIAEYLRLATKARDEMMVSRIRAYVMENTDRRITLDQLAAMSGREKSYFNRCYKSEVGLTPMDDVRRIRIQKAIDLWRTGTMNLSEIAERVCVSDASALSHLFKKYTGYSPRNLPEEDINLLRITEEA